MALRIASLLPSSTEILFALGLGEQVVGVSHECDYPAAVRDLPVVTFSRVDSVGGSRAIDNQVRNLIQAGLSLYGIHENLLESLQPGLIVTQDTCRVCAVSLEDVCRTVQARFGAGTSVLSLSPRRLDDVFEDIRRVASAAGVAMRATTLIGALVARLSALRARVAGKRRPRVLALEWLDPPMAAGHWTPELIEIAGGEPVLGHRGEPTRGESWQRVAASEAEVLLLAPCGFKVGQTRRELDMLLARPEVKYLPAARDGRVFVADGNAYFNRPGPRLVESAEIAAAAIHGLKFEWMTANDISPAP